MTISDFWQGILLMGFNLWPVVVGGVIVAILDRMEAK